VWERSDHTERGRDGCRVPMPWSGEEPPFGFSSSPDTWLPMPAEWSTLTVEKQDGVDGSTLEFFRRAIELRHGRADLGSGVEWLATPTGVLAFQGPDGVTCLLNATDHPVPLSDEDVLITSAPLVGGDLPPNAAAWVS
jgi:alpha-glucosidase